ncbi:MAG: hypothetical protein CM1200mP30_31130 [Pseudomonadota bacterium]|nr:MAG: hypothetical protein CM1200mP30_31130 [Pseudomonadota bacterium]
MLESHLLGRESIIAYSDCIKDVEEARELRRKWRWLPGTHRLAACSSYLYTFYRLAVSAFVDYLRGGWFCFFS